MAIETRGPAWSPEPLSAREQAAARNAASQGQSSTNLPVQAPPAPTPPPSPPPTSPFEQVIPPKVVTNEAVGATGKPTTTYTVQAGDTLSALAIKHGTTVQALVEANKGNPVIYYKGSDPRVYAGYGLNIPNAGQAISQLPSRVTPGAVGGNEIQPVPTGQDVGTQIQGEIDRIWGGMSTSPGGGMALPPAPAAPDYVAQYQQFRQQYGVDPLESELATVENQINTITGQYEEAIKGAEDSLAPLAKVRLRQEKLGKEATFELSALTRSRDSLVNQLKMKYDTIGTIMDLTAKTYDSARQDYEFKWNQTYQMLNFVRGVQKDEENRLQSTWTTLMDAAKSAAKTGGVLPDNLQLNLKQLEYRLGIPQGTSQFILDSIKEQGPEIKSSWITNDKSSVILLGEDGSVKVVKTGVIDSSGGSTGKFFSRTDLTELGLPLDALGQSMSSLNSPTPPDWFVTSEESKTSQNLLKNVIADRWGEFRKKLSGKIEGGTEGTFDWKSLTQSEKQEVVSFMATLPGFSNSDINKLDSDPDFANYILGEYYKSGV